MCWNSALVNEIITSIRYMKFISAILNLYRRFSNYINDFCNISTIRHEISTYRQKSTIQKGPLFKKAGPLPITYLQKKRSSCVNPGSKFISPLWRTYTILPRQILVGFLDYKYATRPFLL